MDKEKPELCQIRIMFPVKSDEQAIGCKQKLEAVLSEIPDANMSFTLATMSSIKPDGSQIR